MFMENQRDPTTISANMGFKQALDRWLTTPPEEDDYHEAVGEKFTDEFYTQNAEWIIESKVCCRWIDKCRHLPPEQTAMLIERAHKIYLNATRPS